MDSSQTPTERENVNVTCERGRTNPVDRSILTRLLSLLDSSAVAVGAIVLPVAALITEYSLRYLTNFYMNPIPTWIHAVLIGLIPIFVLFSIRARKQNERRRNVARFLIGTAAATAAFYSIAFIPISPIGAYLIALSPIGAFVPALFGFLVLSPMLALIGVLRASTKIAPGFDGFGQRRRLFGGYFVLGLATGMGVIATVEAPRTLTRIGLERLNEDPKDLEALSMLRRFGSTDILLRASYGEFENRGACGFKSPDLLGPVLQGQFIFLNDRCGNGSNDTRTPVSVELARTVYFQVTGRPFYSAVRPKNPAEKGLFQGFNQPVDLGGSQVGGKAEGTSLISSMIDGTVDPEAGFGYFEWNFVFRNAARTQEEARMELVLPPGAIVSRATLWINGEEHEAAFGEKKQVRNAYQQVVSYRRDPLLVTQSAPDRVLVQCFPIAPNGGEMRIRIGLTAPAELSEPLRAAYRLPSFSERNFAVSPNLTHSIWVESKYELSAPDGTINLEGISQLAAENTGNGAFGFRGSIRADTDESLAEVIITASRPAATAGGSNMIGWDEIGSRQIEAKIDSVELAPLKRVVLAVDGSNALEHLAPALAKTVERLPIRGEAALVIAGDAPIVVSRLKPVTPDLLGSFASEISSHAYAGGTNNLPALAAAWDIAAQFPDAVVVWIHGPQPSKFSGVEELENRARRRPRGTKIISIQVAPGGNRVLADLDSSHLVRPLPVLPSERLSLEPLARLINGGTEWKIQFVGSATANSINLLTGNEKLETAASQNLTPIRSDATVSTRESQQLARLLAKSETDKLIETGHQIEAAQLATKYRIVTQVSGAVVLENTSQYAANNLEPPTNAKVPSVPEPETVLLGVIAMLLVFGSRRRSTSRFQQIRSEVL